MTGINLNIKKKKKMTNKQAFEILSQEREFANLTGWNFVRSIMSNFNAIRKEYEMAQQYLKPSNEFQEVLKLKHNILYKYAEKNDKGEPIIIKDENGNSNYNILPDLIEAANNDLKQLEKDNESVINEGIANYKKYEEILLEEFKGTFVKIDSKHVPENITYAQLVLIKDWINM